MIKLAITGNIASGKTLVESFFKEKGILTLDTDEIVHKILDKYKIDRKKLGNIVFNDKKKLIKLEKILHPRVKKIMDKFFEDNKNEKIIVVSVPQLYESGWEVFFDYVLLVTADDKIRKERLIKRNNFSEEEAQKRLDAQMPQEEKIGKADFVIDNSKSIENTKVQLEKVLGNLL